MPLIKTNPVIPESASADIRDPGQQAWTLKFWVPDRFASGITISECATCR